MLVLACLISPSPVLTHIEGASHALWQDGACLLIATVRRVLFSGAPAGRQWAGQLGLRKLLQHR